MSGRRIGLALAVLLAAPAPAVAVPANGLAERVTTLTRATVWTRRAAIPIRFRTFHPQGMVKIGADFYVSSVEVRVAPKRSAPGDRHDRDTGSGIGHLFKIGPDGRLLADLTLGEGTMYHPGGIDYDGVSIWVPVSEYRPASRAIVYRVDPRTMRATEAFRVADHIGGIVHDVQDGTLRGVSWGSRTFYTWRLDEAGRVAPPTLTANPAQYVDYQDCHYAGDAQMLCAGVGEYEVGPTVPVFQLGGLELIDLKEQRPIWQAPIELHAPSGRVMTQNPAFVEPTATGLRAYFMPDDDASTLYIFDAALP